MQLREAVQEHKTKTTCYLAVQPLPFFLWKSQQETTNTLHVFVANWENRELHMKPLLSIQVTPCRIQGANVATLT